MTIIRPAPFLSTRKGRKNRYFHPNQDNQRHNPPQATHAFQPPGDYEAQNQPQQNATGYAPNRFTHTVETRAGTVTQKCAYNQPARSKTGRAGQQHKNETY